MHISLDQAIGRQPRLNRVGQSILNIGGDASAAYSLRSLTGGEPKAVRIRRDGDNEERDFTTAEIVNEAADWTNGLQETTLPADLPSTSSSITEFTISGTDSQFNSTFTLLESQLNGKNQYVHSSESTRKIRYRSDGKWELDQDGDQYQVSVDVGRDYPWDVVDWVQGPEGSGGDPVFSSFVGGNPDNSAAAAYSLRKVKSDYTGHAVRIRREFDDIEVNVSFDTNNEVSINSPISDVVEEGGEKGDTTATTLGGFITQDVLHYESDFTSGTNSYLTQTSNITLSAPSGSFNGEEDYLLATCSANATLFLQRNIDISSGDTYRVDFKVFIPNANNDNTPFLNNTGTNVSDPVTVTKGSWQDVSITLAITSSTNRLPRIIFSLLAGEVLYFKDIKYTVTSGANASVHTWYDQSGNSKNATQTTDDNQPLIAAGGVLQTKLGKPAINFTAGTTFLENASLSITETEVSYFIVGQPARDGVTSSEARNRTFFSFTGDTTFIGTPNSSSQMSWKRFGSGNSFSLNFTNLNTTNLHSAIGTSSGANYYLNSSSIYSNSLTGSNTTRNGIRIGTKFFVTSHDSEGYFSEFIIYNSDQTNNRFKIESNIFNHYGILDGTSLSSSPAFFLDGTTGSPSSFTANGLDGFTMIMGGQGNVRAGIELQNKVPSGKHVVVSFDADLTLGTGTASPQIKLMANSLSGTGGGTIVSIIQGRNTISLNSNNNDSKFVLFIEGNFNVGYSISNFTMSLRDKNGFVNKWYDQSGNSNDATAVADADEPKIVKAGSYLGELEFDGSDDVLEFTTAEVAASDKISVFMTLTGPSSGDKSLLGSSIAFPIRRFSGSNKLASLTNAGLHRLDSTSNFTDTNTGIITLIRDLAVPSGLLAIDGTVEDTVSNSYGLSSAYQIGAKLSGSSNGRFADIKCKELIVYATNQTTNRTAIETNIANEYGITLS